MGHACKVSLLASLYRWFFKDRTDYYSKFQGVMEGENALYLAIMSGKLVLLIGPSGVGKSVILQSLRDRHPEVHFPRSATTRDRREGEGDDLYHFVSDADFDQLLKEGKVLEYAVVHGQKRYGTLVDEIIPYIDRGDIVIREVDVQGFDSIANHQYFREKDSGYELQSIFILPEDNDQLIRHITERAPMSQEELKRRIASMEIELAHAKDCDIRIVNREGKLEETIAEVEETIFGK